MQLKKNHNDFENTFISLLNFISDPIVIINREGEILDVNAAFEEAVGFKCNRLIGKNFSEVDFLEKESKAILAKNLKERLNGCDIEPYEIKIPSKEGKTKYFETKGRKIDYSGEPADLVLFHDITERKRTQNRLENSVRKKRRDLEASENKLRSVLYSSPDPIVVTDLNGNLKDCNPAALKTFGYMNSKDVIGKNFLEFIVKKDQQRAFREFRSLIIEGSKRTAEFTVLAKDEHEFPAEFSASIIFDDSKKPNGLVGIIKDITERKKVEFELKQKIDLLEAVTKNLSAGLILIDGNYRIIWSNKIAEWIFGKNIKHQTCFKHLSKRNSICSGCGAKEIFEGAKAHEHEFSRIDKDGNFFAAQVTTTPLRDENGTVVAALELVVPITQRKQIEQKLVNAEKRYHTLFNNAPLGVLILDPETKKFVEFNDTAASQLGYNREEFAKLTVFDIEAKENAAQIDAHTADLVKERETEFETMFRSKDGEIRNVLVTTKAIELGEKLLIYGIYLDITEIKRYQEALVQSEAKYHELADYARESEERSRAVIANSPIGIATSDNNTRFISANKAFCKILRYTEDELSKLTFKDITFPEDVKKSTAKVRELARGRISSFTLEKRYIRKDRSLINGKIMVSTLRDQTGKPTLFIAELQDVTEQREKERQLRNERNKLDAITENINVGLLVIDKDYRITWCNKFEKMFNGPQILGQKCYSTIRNKHTVCPDCGVKRVFEGAKIDVREIKIEKYGQERVLEITVTPLKDGNENVVGALELAIDLTEMKKLQSELSDYSQKLEVMVQERTKQLEEAQLKLVKSERLAAIGELAGMIGHDLRNPLTAIKNAAYYMKKKGAQISPVQDKEMLETIDRCVERSNKIINDLLDYSREIHLERQKSSPARMLAEAINVLQIPNEVQIVNRLSDGPHLVVDPYKIERVFANIIKNAVEAMPKGGEIIIDGKKEKDQLEISFTDNGMGISEEAQSKIFSPLCTTKAQGMGFGLAICKRIIDAHGGSIKVKTAKDKGTTFAITLPLEPKTETEASQLFVNVPETLPLSSNKTLKATSTIEKMTY